ncbi:MAG: hypothetical protein HUN04_04785 [Desulfobacter sp.]|nr:MAG: hypothetical protein HUN04_04785 [Desulfobacter sp.]
MEMPNKKGWLAVLFILICLAIPFGMTYYVSTDGFKDDYAHWRGEVPQAPADASVENIRRVDGRVTLVLGERISIHNTSLVYKGVENGRVNVDLYLEELDPARAYPQSFPESGGQDRVVRFGDVSYRVKGLGKNSLVLEILETMGAN